jgi:uncharacterized membrane protein (UPF0136 family)
MQTAAIIVWVYGAMVLVGGVLGYVKAQSKPSLISGLVFGSALIVVGYGIRQGRAADVLIAAGLAGLLAVVMGIRFGKTKKFMPAGLLTILSVVVAVTLLLMR